MKRFHLLLIIIFLLSPLIFPQNKVRVDIIQTTDLHGRIMPYNYFNGKEVSRGLAKVATYIKEVRKKYKNVILVDNGDTIQGTPLTYYFEVIRKDKINPMALIMNYLHYDCATIGNHEYNYGLDVLFKYQKDLHCPLLSANTYKKGAKWPFFKPYIVKNFDGVKIAIIGLTTSNIPNWEPKEHIDDLIWKDTAKEAQKWVKYVREKEKVDAVIIDTHEGFGADLKTGKPDDSFYESKAYFIAKNVKGVDVLLTGHAHRNIPPFLINGVLASQGSCWGKYVTHDVLIFEKINGKWKITKKYGHNIKMKYKIPPDPEVVKLIEPYHNEVLKWVNSIIGYAEGDFTTETVQIEDNPLMDLLENIMKETVHSQMAMASYLPGHPITIKKGPIRVRDIYSFYIYENSLVSLELSGRDIKEALEHSAEYYGNEFTWNPVEKILNLKINPKFRHYNFDTLQGATYVINPLKPVGKRIERLYFNNLPMDMGKKYSVAVSSYQAYGGGQYEMFKRAKILEKNPSDIRNLMIKYIKVKGKIYPTCDQNWYLKIPVNLIKPEWMKKKK